MIEMYGFIAAFTAQIIIFSVLGPLGLISGLRGQIEQFIAERAPAIDPSATAAVHQRLRLLRLLGLGTGVIGVVLLVVMIRYMLRPDWQDGPLEPVVPAYFLVQMLPAFLAVVTVSRFHGMLKRALPQEKRTAVLQPRGLFDFVSRSAVALAVLVYFLFIAFLLYIEQHPFPGYAGLLVNIAFLTLLYAVMALAIYFRLRTMTSSPLQARDDRIRSAGVAVRVSVYSCIGWVVFWSLNMTLVLLDQQRWEPTFISISFIVIGLLSRMALREQMRIPEGTGHATAAFTR